jgi:formylmethanofuran dehydrogenase subunit E
VEGILVQYQKSGHALRAISLLRCEKGTFSGRGNMGSIVSYTFEEYAAIVKSFHGSTAPGVIIGGFMVDLAHGSLPEGGVYDVICETAKCLPDAVQLLTPCSIGNRWLKIIDVGRYALTFYEKRTGAGVRVYLDCAKLESWPEVRAWYLKLKPKEAQDDELLLRQIREAGREMCSVESVQVSPGFFKKQQSGPISICPSCGEAYHAADGAICPACKGGVLPYPSGNGLAEKDPLGGVAGGRG